MTPPPDGVVGVLAAPGSTLAAALRAGLGERGWTTLGWSGEIQLPAANGIVVVVEDDLGRPLPGSWAAVPVRRWVCIGSLRSSGLLASLAIRGAVVLNQDVPFLPLVQRVEEALTRATVPRSSGVQMATAVRARAAEATALSRLTERERIVLCGLVHGKSAQRIADDGYRAVTTIRSQIQALMRRLDVSSQVSAVALAHRSGRSAGLAGCMETLHQF